MLRGFKQSILTRSIDPAIPILGILAIVLALFFVIGFRHVNTVAEGLPIAAFAICLVFLLVPQRLVSQILLWALALSVPFAHFAVVIMLGQGVQWAHLFGFLLIAHLIGRLLLAEAVPVAPATPWALAFVVASFISIFAIVDQPGKHIEEFWKSEVQLLFVILLYIAVTRVRITEKQLMFVLKTLILVSVGVALFGVYQLPARFYDLPGAVLRLNNPSLSGPAQTTTLMHHITRASSIFSEPSNFGHYMGCMIALSLPAVLHRPKLFGNTFLTWTIVAIQTTGLVFSFSMGSYYMLALMLLMMIFIECGAVRRKLIVGLVAAVGIAVAAMLSVEIISGFPSLTHFLDRTLGIYKYAMGDQSYLIEGESVFMRIDNAKVGLAVWYDNLLYGVGMGSYTLVSYRYGNWNPFGWAANTFVNVLAETGIIGFLTLIGFGLATVFPLFRIFNRKPDNSRSDGKSATDESWALAARMLFYLCVVEFVYFHLIGSIYWPSVWFFFGLGGLVVINARKRKHLINI